MGGERGGGSWEGGQGGKGREACLIGLKRRAGEAARTDKPPSATCVNLLIHGGRKKSARLINPLLING